MSPRESDGHSGGFYKAALSSSYKAALSSFYKTALML